MDKNFEIPDDKLNLLVNMVSKKMGMTPTMLRSKLEDGSFDNVVKNLNANDAKKVNNIVNNPALVNKILTDPKTKSNLDSILNGKNGAGR